MKLGICTAADTLDTLPDGLDYIEESVGGALCPREDETAFEAALAKCKGAAAPVVAANCFIPGDLKSTGPDVDAAALDDYVATALARAERVGIDKIVFGSGGSRRVPDGFDKAEAFDQLVGHLKRWGPIAAKHGVTIVIEPLQTAECNIVNTVTEGAELAGAADHPNVKLLADFYHMACDGEGPESIRQAGDLLQHCHTAEKDKRTAPGAAGDDFRPYLKALKDIGYTGAISLECGWGDMQAEASGALAEFRRQWEEA
ncbi:MAG: sugar phosphate isomerase/epimerase family protein [Planctomycetota bacterium]|jgi:sugar phosphate isomerase/epimerase